MKWIRRTATHTAAAAAVAAAVAAALAPTAPAAADEAAFEPLGLEIGVLVGYHDNFFFRGGGAEAPSDRLLNVYFSAERERRVAGGKLELSVDAGYHDTQEIAGTDYFGLTGGALYKWGRNRASGELFHRPNQVYFDDGDGVFFDQTGVEVGYRRDLRPGLWVGASYEVEQLRFDPVEAARDATGQELAASLRVPLNPRYGLRGTWIREERDADSPRYDLTGDGFALALEARPAERVSVFARYKRRQRGFERAPAESSNFGRRDTVEDVIVNLRWQVGERWGLRAEDFYRRGESTRPDRNYDGNRFLVGAFFLF